MDNTRKAAALIGAIMLLQLFAGPTVNFVLMGPAEAAPGFLVNAASHATAVALAVVLALSMALCSLCIPVLAWPILRPCSHATALLLLALGIANFSTEVAEQTASLTMLTLSQKFSLAASSDAAMFQGLDIVVGTAHKWAHYLNLIVGGVSLSVFYLALLRFRLIPRPLAAFGLLATVLLLHAVLTPVFGGPIRFMLLAPIGLAQLGVSLWLLIRGVSGQANGAGAAPSPA